MASLILPCLHTGYHWRFPSAHEGSKDGHCACEAEDIVLPLAGDRDTTRLGLFPTVAAGFPTKRAERCVAHHFWIVRPLHLPPWETNKQSVKSVSWVNSDRRTCVTVFVLKGECHKSEGCNRLGCILLLACLESSGKARCCSYIERSCLVCECEWSTLLLLNHGLKDFFTQPRLRRIQDYWILILTV